MVLKWCGALDSLRERSESFVRAHVSSELKLNNLPSMDFEMASTSAVSMVVHLAVKLAEV